MKMPMGAGRVVARSYMALALGLFGLNCFRGGMSGEVCRKVAVEAWARFGHVH